jgi:hypothetical protein
MVGRNDDDHILGSPDARSIAGTPVPPFHEGNINVPIAKLFSNHRVPVDMDIDVGPGVVFVGLEIRME